MSQTVYLEGHIVDDVTGVRHDTKVSLASVVGGGGVSGNISVDNITVSASSVINWLSGNATFQIGGVDILTLGTDLSADFAGTVNASVFQAEGFNVTGSGGLQWNDYGFIAPLSDGVFYWSNSSANDFKSLWLGGATADYPGIIRNGTTIEFHIGGGDPPGVPGGFADILAGVISATGGSVLLTGRADAAPALGIWHTGSDGFGINVDSNNVFQIDSAGNRVLLTGIDNTTGLRIGPHGIDTLNATGTYVSIYGNATGGGTAHISTDYTGADGPLTLGTKTTPTTLVLGTSGSIGMPTLPTSDPHVVGNLWNSAGTLKISAG